MGRVSQAQAQENRKRVVETAARLFRERGVAGVSVADVMGEAGLTHGGFYKQFASKEALVAEAVGQAFAEADGKIAAAGRDGFVRSYLAPGHRDSPGDGCPAAGFGGDLTHEHTPGAVEAYAQGIEAYARELGSLTDVATLVGALVLARATAGAEISDRILAEARAALLSEG
ncbi:TetR/AcrR family transcriptional regulator [Actinoplanes sp. CA-030573]|uniref:TetR/AcrR family transcriptional regulator n=1 Tax=Actinoplanes sp. CA-030573 TaxID=3239898 RepID=UPI003D8D7709